MTSFTNVMTTIAICMAIVALVGMNGHSVQKFGYSGFSRMNMTLATGSVATYLLADWIRGSAGMEHQFAYEVISYMASAVLVAGVVARNVLNTNGKYGTFMSFVQIPVLLTGGIVVLAIVLAWIGFSVLALVLGEGSEEESASRASWKKRQEWYLNEVNPLGPNCER